MTYLVQTIDGKVVHDFAFALLRAQEYYLWLGEPFDVILFGNAGMDAVIHPNDYVPVVSIEFVSAFLRHFYPASEAALRPLNVPEVLFPCGLYGLNEPLKYPKVLSQA